MGSLIGYCYISSGDKVQVTFSANELSGGELPPIVSLQTQMDGDSEYQPMKTTTASIGLLVDGMELMELCTANYPIKVDISLISTRRSFFLGYIVPNSYNQRVTGINDIITIECVDAIGYAKYVRYQQIDAAAGFKALRLADVITRCFDLMGFVDQDCSLLMPGSLLVAREDLDALAINAIVVNEEYFYDSNLPDEVTGDYLPLAMSCEDVLKMIAESFRLTWLTDGHSIYLCDMLSARYDAIEYFDLLTGNTVALPISRDITEDNIADGSVNVSSLPRISMTEVHHELSKKIVVLQDPFDEATLSPVAGYVIGTDREDKYHRVISISLESNIYDVLNDQSAIAMSRFVAWRDADSVTSSPEDPVFIEDYAWGDGSWTVALKMYSPRQEGLAEILRRKIRYTTSVIGEPSMVDNPRTTIDIAARALRIEAEVVISDGETDNVYENYLYPRNEKSIDCKLYASVIVDGLYFDPDSKTYVPEQKIITIKVHKDGTATWDINTPSWLAPGIPIPASGQLEVVIYGGGEANIGWTNAWLKKLQLAIHNDALEEDLSKPKVERCGTYDIDRAQSISPALDLYYNLTDRPLGVGLLGNASSASRPSLQYIVDTEQLSLCEYAHALANMGDRLQWEIPLRDEANNISPLDVFTCQKWQDCKVLSGYSRNIIDNNITVTLI